MTAQIPLFDTLAIVGVGLIGGSAALAARRAGLVRRIVGVGRVGANMDDALRLGVIDAALPLEQAVSHADLILLAIPVGQMPQVMDAIAPHLAAHAIVTDAGSTKGDVVAAARTHMGMALPRFVPGHPIAGAERSGVLAARAELFDGKKVVLTPLPENPQAVVRAVAAYWRGCGAKVEQMPVATHDHIFAVVSHLPHVLAFALVVEIAHRPDAELLFSFAAGGFRDFSRIAGSSPEMWRDICLANRHAILQEIAAYSRRLAQLSDLIAAGDGHALGEMFSHARDVRASLAEAQTTKK